MGESRPYQGRSRSREEQCDEGGHSHCQSGNESAAPEIFLEEILARLDREIDRGQEREQRESEATYGEGKCVEPWQDVGLGKGPVGRIDDGSSGDRTHDDSKDERRHRAGDREEAAPATLHAISPAVVAAACERRTP